MQDRALSLLGIAAKAGKVAAGGFLAERAVKDRKARLVIVARDAGENTAKRFTDKCSFYKIPLCFYGSRETLGQAVGRESRACVAVTDRGLAEGLRKWMGGAPDGGGDCGGDTQGGK